MILNVRSAAANSKLDVDWPAFQWSQVHAKSILQVVHLISGNLNHKKQQTPCDFESVYSIKAQPRGVFVPFDVSMRTCSMGPHRAK